MMNSAMGIPLAVTAAVALAYRLLWFSQVAAEPALLLPVLDGAAHLEWARGLLAGTWPGDEPFFRAPGYVAALAMMLALAGDDPARVAALQLGLGAVTPVLVAGLAGRLYGVAAAWLAGLGAALYPMFPFFDGQLLVPVLAVPLTVAAVITSMAALETGGRGRLVLAAALWSVIGIVRPPLLLGAMLLPGFLVMRRRAREAVLAISVILTLPVLLTVRNVAVGDAVFVASQGGLNFYLGNGTRADGVAATFPDAPTALGYGMLEAATRQAEAREERELRPSEVSRHYRARTFDEIAADPSRWFGLLVKKALLFWGDREIPNNHDPALFVETVPVMRWAPGWWMWAPLGIVGLWLARRTPGLVFVAGVVATVWVVNIVFFVNARFRIPAAPLLIVAGAGAATMAAEWIRGGRWRAAAVVVAAAVGLGFLLRANPYGIPRDVWPMSYVLVAEAEHDRGEPVRALRWIKRALAVEPSLYPARFAQAQLLRRAGRVVEARGIVERLIVAAPNDAALRNEHGVLLDVTGESEAALAEIEAAARLDPSLDAAFVNRAIVLTRLDRIEEARSALLDFLRERPTSAEARRAREVLGGLASGEASGD
jgi:hypothetical protein